MQAALNQGQQALWDEAADQGVIDDGEFLKTWLTAPDDRLCPICEELEGESVEMSGDFSIGVSQPPAHPQCRCATGLVKK